MIILRTKAFRDSKVMLKVDPKCCQLGLQTFFFRTNFTFTSHTSPKKRTLISI